MGSGEENEAIVHWLGLIVQSRRRSGRLLQIAQLMARSYEWVESNRYLSRGAYRTKERFVVEMENLINGSDKDFKADVSAFLWIFGSFSTATDSRIPYKQVRMYRSSCERLVSLIQDHQVFINNSQNSQAPVAYQLLVCLLRMGKRGNGMSTLEASRKTFIGRE